MTKQILSVGFDLDNTLFKPNVRINEYIRSYACRRAAEQRGQSYDQVRAIFDEKYALLNSARGSFREMGVEGIDDILQASLEQEEIVALLQPDEALNAMLMRLAVRYSLFLITTNTGSVSLKKLSALRVDSQLFDPKIYELDTPERTRKDGSAFQIIAQQHAIELSRMFFVGDREVTDIIPAKKLGITTAIVHAHSSHADYELQEIYQIEEILYSIEKMKNPSEA